MVHLISSLDRPASRVPSAVIEVDQQNVEPSVIEWLLHDDQVKRESVRHAAAVVKSAMGASMVGVTLLDAEHQYYRADADDAAL